MEREDQLPSRSGLVEGVGLVADPRSVGYPTERALTPAPSQGSVRGRSGTRADGRGVAHAANRRSFIALASTTSELAASASAAPIGGSTPTAATATAAAV